MNSKWKVVYSPNKKKKSRQFFKMNKETAIALRENFVKFDGRFICRVPLYLKIMGLKPIKSEKARLGYMSKRLLKVHGFKLGYLIDGDKMWVKFNLIDLQLWNGSVRQFIEGENEEEIKDNRQDEYG